MQREYEPLVQEFLRLLREEFSGQVRSMLVFGPVGRDTPAPAAAALPALSSSA